MKRLTAKGLVLYLREASEAGVGALQDVGTTSFQKRKQKVKEECGKKKRGGGGQGDLQDLGVDKGFSVTLKAKSI